MTSSNKEMANGSSLDPSEQIVEQPKSKNADKKEAKRAEKAAKLAAKTQAMAAKEASANVDKKDKESAGGGKKGKGATSAEVEAEEDERLAKSTAHGQKKDMSRPMAAAYNPGAVEAGWYSWWEQERFYSPDVNDALKRNKADIYVVPAPPPNVTGSLHIGHALTSAIQDALIRWNRMCGKTVLFHPGFDHAGIATQSVVEKRLYAQNKQTRYDLGREEFIKRVYLWKDDYQARISRQLKMLGASYDWERARFTMDDMLSKAVKEAFVRLHDDGIIYRANRLVNWCTQLNTTLSNLEVDQKDLPGRTLLSVPGYPDERVEFGVIISFRYPIEGSDDHIVVATTRVETMLGDTAIAVHPDDDRYKHLHGKFAIHPFNKRRIPIVTDDIAVDMKFGTGAVKITPAHDPNDYEVGKRHNLEFINILNDNGTMNENAGPEFQGKRRFHVRRQIVERLQELGLFVEKKDNPMQIPICSRSGDVIEPIMKPQWWVECTKLAGPAIQAVKDGRLIITPKQSEGDWFRWLENTQDWCISRQLWWGHRVPAYFIKLQGDDSQDRASSEWYVSGRNVEEATRKADKIVGGRAYDLEEDEDVLDTWFSSGLWPFSIQGWPDETPDLNAFYPASLLETGWDILFFWVARMVLLGMHLTGKVPFKEVFCHAIIRDAYGRKMSKSLGNVIDPLDVIQGASLESLHSQLRNGNLDQKEISLAEQGQKKTYPKGIPQCGADALRFSLCSYTTPGARDINLDVLRIEGYRKFGNKLWNATRFALMKLDADFKPQQAHLSTKGKSLIERWILHRLNEAAKVANENMKTYNMFAVTSAIHQFWLYELCDVYIEYIKPFTDDNSSAGSKLSYLNTLHASLDAGLKFLHPFMPFITEELWQRLPRPHWENAPSISLASYPRYVPDLHDPEAESDFTTAFDVVRAIRSLAAEYSIQNSTTAFVQTKDQSIANILETELEGIKTLVKGCTSIELLKESSSDDKALPEGCASQLISANLSASIMVKGMVDITTEVAKLEKRKGKVVFGLSSLQKDRNKSGYREKTPKDVQDADQEKIHILESDIALIEKSIENFLKIGD